MMKKQSLAFAASAIALSIALIFSVRFLNPPLRSDIEQPAFKSTPHIGTWTARHPGPPPVPTGDEAIGDPGSSKPVFVDIAAKSGLKYRWTIEGLRPLDILQTIGNGCAFLDFDNDGNLDILLIGPKLALYKGDGHGNFTDVTHATGLDKLSGHFLGCAVGDYDNDGFDDIYLSGFRTGVLLHNEHGRSFRDVTKAALLPVQPWGSACAWGDVDGDGRLDLYVGNYVQYDPGKSQRLCSSAGLMRSCGPGVYPPSLGMLFHNDGNGVFRNVTAQWQAAGFGKCLGAAFADYDGSGRQSLGLANDEMVGNLLQNHGAGFSDMGKASGFGFMPGANIHAGMGIDWGDYDNDGHLDATVMAFSSQAKSIYRNMNNGTFEDLSTTVLLAEPTKPNVAFGCKWLDYDNDGWLDLMIANGHVYDNAGKGENTEKFLQATQLFHNDHGRLFVDMSTKSGPDLQRPILGRGLATGDFDNDGRVDALVVDSEGAPLLLHNESAPVGHYLMVGLIGTKSNRDGYGAILTATAGGLTQTRLCHSDGSYFSSSDKRVHIGLGGATVVDKLSIRWPSGHVDTLFHVAADRRITVQEGSAKPVE